jgi:hypothetical protein
VSQTKQHSSRRDYPASRRFVSLGWDQTSVFFLLV